MQPETRSVVLMRGSRAAFLPLAITFGALTVLFLALGQQTWVVFLPLTITFAILSATKGGPEDDEDDDVADPHGQP